MAVTGPAHADKGFGETDGGGGTDTGAGVDGDTVSVTAGGVVYDRSKNGGGGSSGALTSTTSWSPPACWYAPKYTPEQ
ncbi:hypothetical protein ACWIGN_21725, partial [Streptomyces albidoflavus]